MPAARWSSAALAVVLSWGVVLGATSAAAQEPSSTPPSSPVGPPSSPVGPPSSPVGLVAPEEPYRPTPPPYESSPNTLAWVSLVSGGVFLATGIGFGVAAVVKQREARDIDQRFGDDEEATEAARQSYDDAIATRDDLRIVSGIAGGTGLGLFLLAGVLFAREDIRRDQEQKKAAPVSGDVAATPWVGPGIAGGAATVSF